MSEPDLANAEKIGFRFEWVGAMSDTSGRIYPSFWQINGKAWEGGEEHKHNAPPLAKLRKARATSSSCATWRSTSTRSTCMG